MSNAAETNKKRAIVITNNVEDLARIHLRQRHGILDFARDDQARLGLTESSVPPSCKSC
jgi:hypothetical protein